MDYIKNIATDEIRSGYLVTTDRKKQWNKLMAMLVTFDRICQKHDICYYLTYGSLLGAVRHGGFVPWDDDIDIHVPRPGYERLKAIMPAELKPPLVYLPSFYTKHIIIDTGTLNTKVDIIPLDIDRNPNISYSDEMELTFRTLEELVQMVLSPNHLAGMILRGEYQPILPLPTLEKLAAASPEYISQVHAEFALKHYHDSDYCNHYAELDLDGKRMGIRLHKAMPKDWFAKGQTILFEGLSFPCPVEIETVLKFWYHDWQIEKRYIGGHGLGLFSADLSEEEYQKELRDF